MGEPKPGAAGAEGGGLGTSGFREDEGKIGSPYEGDLAGGSASMQGTSSGRARPTGAGSGYDAASTSGGSMEGGANTSFGTAAARDPSASNSDEAERDQRQGGSPG